MQLAQVNIARMKAPLDDPMMKAFFDFIAPINQLAEDSPGFIWRLKDEEGNSSVHLDLPFDDQLLLLNMSVWKDIPSLQVFTYKTVHSYFVKNRKRWFDTLQQHHMAMWWIPDGAFPDLAEAGRRLATIQQRGASADAFSFARPYDATGQPLP
jgi:hypothetical protein